MIQVLPYNFKRRSKNHFDWMLNVIKSESYFKADSVILDKTFSDFTSKNIQKSA